MNEDDKIPDINKIDEIVSSILDLEVLGGYSRSYGIGEDGQWEPDRYIETLRDYISEFALRTALEHATKYVHYVDRLDGIIISQSKDELWIEYDDGSIGVFKREENEN